MEKKPKTPPPPRRVQAPKQRGTASAPVEERRRRMILYVAAATGFIGLAVALAIIAFGGSGGGGGGNVAAAMKSAGCTLRTFKAEARAPHLNTLTPTKKQLNWNSFPPTSGYHHFQPAIWGSYDKPVAEVQLVHNLEHGGVVIQYGSKVPPSEVSKLSDFYRSDANAIIVAPLPQLGATFALTAWTHLAECPRFDEKAFAAFRKAYRYQGPEKFPPSLLNPGQ